MISHLKDAPKGFITRMTPTKPKISADHLNKPTCSFKKIIEKKVIKIGEIKKIAVASASGNTAIPAKKAIFATTTHDPLKNRMPGFLVFKILIPPSKGIKTVKQITIATIERKNVSS